MTEVIMPKYGDGMEEGTLVEWLKKEGETVKAGDILANIQTDKATLEMETPVAGTLAGILLQAGGTVPVGQPIAAILAPGESLPAGWGGASAPSTPAIQPADAIAAQKVTVPAEQTAAPASSNGASASPVQVETPASQSPIVSSDVRLKASPLARKIAAAQGVEIASLTGSGPGGRIVAKDVEGYKPSETEPPVTETPEASQIAASESRSPIETKDTTLKLNKIRQITAKRTQESKSQVPHFYVTVEVDLEKILALRELFEEEESGKVSINDFVVKASALALREMPEVNAFFQGDSLLLKGGVHIGIAVALPEGLTVPVVKHADTMGLRAISASVKDLARRAKENKLGMDELTGSTFAISNMGMLDVDNFLAIINQPNSAILAIASARKKVVVGDNDEIEIRTRMNITCSFDHRVADGAVGAKFINVVKRYLENPTRLLS